MDLFFLHTVVARQTSWYTNAAMSEKYRQDCCCKMWEYRASLFASQLSQLMQTCTKVHQYSCCSDIEHVNRKGLYLEFESKEIENMAQKFTEFNFDTKPALV